MSPADHRNSCGLKMSFIFLALLVVSLGMSQLRVLADPLTGSRVDASADAAQELRGECPSIAFIRRDNYGMNGTNAVMFSQRTGVGSAICVFDPNAEDPTPETVFETQDGFIFNMNPSYDGKRLVFSYKTQQNQPFHVWEINTDGTGLRQLTDGPYHDHSPVYYPDGRIIFSSSRVESYSLCQNYLACGLYSIDPEYPEPQRFDFTSLCTLSPAVMSDGSILCTRWEYQDKNIFAWEGLWTIRPDGRNLQLYHGNTFRIPNAVYGGRPIPDTNRVIVVWAAHHRVPIGDLAIVDRSLGLESFDSMWKVTHVTPVEKDLASGDDWRKTGIGNGPADALFGEAFCDPFPITKRTTVVAYGGDGPRHNLYLLDNNTGETCLLHAEPNDSAGCFSPVPLASRPLPPAIPGDCPQESGSGTFYVQDVYRGLGEQGVERGQVTALRIMSQSPKKYNTEGPRYHDHYPVVGHGSYYVKENHGTVPVAENGSAYFRAPSNTEIYFIALDKDGRELQRMGSVTQITTDDFVSCVGCHDDRLSAPPAVALDSERLAKGPDDITPPSWGVGPVDFVTQVQPVLDQYCIECHSGPTPDGRIDLTGDKTRFYSMAYESLVFDGWTDYYYINKGPNGVFPALSTGSWVSRIATEIIETNHEEIDMDDQSRRCLYAWIDANVPYYGTWEMTRPYSTGGRDAYAATFPREGADLNALTPGVVDVRYAPWIDRYNELWKRIAPERIQQLNVARNGGNTFDPRTYRINLTNPEWSPAATWMLAESAGGYATDEEAVFLSPDDPDYKAFLLILQEAGDWLYENPRIDMDGAVPLRQTRDFGRTF
jgi:hypothetical protein